MPVHAFVDESRRGSAYCLAAAIVEPANLRELRRALRSLLLPGQRELHFNDQRDPRRRVVSGAIARLPIELRVYRRTCGRKDESARQTCIDRVTRDLLVRGAHRLVLDTRAELDDLDDLDEATIRAILAKREHRTRLVYEHVDSASECLLWVADAVAWCFGAGGHWRKRVDCIVEEFIDLDQV